MVKQFESLIPGHVKSLRQAAVQVEVMADHAPGSVPLPVQHIVVYLVHNVYWNHWKLLKHRHPCCQSLQFPVRLHSNEGGSPSLVLEKPHKETCKSLNINILMNS